MDGAGLLGVQPQKGGGASVPVASAMPVDQSFDPESVQVDQVACAAELAEAVVWAESVRPAVNATPTSPCSCWMIIAGLLQLALFVTFALSLTTAGVVMECPPGMNPADCSTDMHHRNEYGGGILVLCVMIVIEFCACPSARFLRNILQDGSAYQHVENVRKAPPSVHWHIQCYHYETRHYTETRTDSEGKKHTEHKTERVRRDTWRASFEYVPYYWEDISSPFPDIGTASLTRLTFDKQMAFADAASAQHFSQSKRQFIRMNRRDIHYDFREEFNIPGFTSNVLACKDAGAVPTWLNQWFFYLASLCCLTVPYRIAFAKLCWEVPEYRYIKRFYSAPVAPIYCPFPVLTVCTATMPVAQAVPVQQPMAAAAVAVPTAGAVAVPMAASAPPANVVPSPSPAPFAAAAAVVASPAPMGGKE